MAAAAANSCATTGRGVLRPPCGFHQADWLDFNSIQSGHVFMADSYAFVSNDYALTPPKPTVDMEPAYENHPTGAGQPPIDSHKVRTQAYLAMLCRGGGTRLRRARPVLLL